MHTLLTFLTNAYIIAIGFCFMVSLRVFKEKGNRALKIFSTLLGVTFIVECIAVYVFVRNPYFNMPLYNDVISSTLLKVAVYLRMPLYNVFMLVEFMVYAIFFRMIIENKMVKKLIQVYIGLLPVFWYWIVFEQFEFRIWNSYLMVTGSVFTAFFAGSYCRELLQDNFISNLKHTPEFWIAAALFVFYLWFIPFMGTLNYVSKAYRDLAQWFLAGFKLANCALYTMIAIGYLCHKTNTRKSLSSS